MNSSSPMPSRTSGPCSEMTGDLLHLAVADVVELAHLSVVGVAEVDVAVESEAYAGALLDPGLCGAELERAGQLRIDDHEPAAGQSEQHELASSLDRLESASLGIVLHVARERPDDGL